MYAASSFLLPRNLQGQPGNSALVTIDVDFIDSIEIFGVQGGTVKWFGDFTRSTPGAPTISGAFGIGDTGKWSNPLIPVSTPFVNGQSIPIFIDLSFWGQCCLDGGDSALYDFSLSQLRVFDAQGNLVQNPQYASASGYSYPVFGGTQVTHLPEPGTWMLAGLGIGLLIAKRRFS